MLDLLPAGSGPGSACPSIGRYNVFQSVRKAPDGTAIYPTFIYLEDCNGQFLRAEHLQDYIAQGENPIVTYRQAARCQCYFFTGMLNYVFFAKHDEYKINCVLDITREMMDEYFDFYGNEVLPDGDKRKPNTVWTCVRICTFTMLQLVRTYGNEMKLKEEDLVKYKTIRNYRGKFEMKLVPAFRVSGGSNFSDHIFRDLPTKAFELLVTLAFRYTPEIAFLICATAFSGLRPSEGCNLRRNTSDSDSQMDGIVFRYSQYSHKKAPFLNVLDAYVMRSDHVSVGSIKRKRLQEVFPDFADAFMAAYKWHMQYLAKHPGWNRSSPDYPAPLFVNLHGNAMTYDNYRKTFARLVKDYFVPALLKSEDQTLRAYGNIVSEKGIQPEIMRHFFSYQLALRGVSVTDLQYFRGDRSPESSQVYLVNKSELMKQTKILGEAMTELILLAGKMKEAENDV